MRLFYFILASSAVFMLLGAHCPKYEGCMVGRTRCNSGRVEICGDDGVYRTLAFCDNVSRQSGAEFTCQYVDTLVGEQRVMGHTCVRVRP